MDSRQSVAYHAFVMQSPTNPGVFEVGARDEES